MVFEVDVFESEVFELEVFGLVVLELEVFELGTNTSLLVEVPPATGRQLLPTATSPGPQTTSVSPPSPSEEASSSLQPKLMIHREMKTMGQVNAMEGDLGNMFCSS